MTKKAEDMQFVREKILMHLVAQEAVRCAVELNEPGALFSALWHEGNAFLDQTLAKQMYISKYGNPNS